MNSCIIYVTVYNSAYSRLFNTALITIDMVTALQTIQRATVGVYGDAAHNILSDSMTRSDYGHAISESVSYLQMFVRPVGDILTNETVREVIDMEPDFADEFATCRNHLAVAATRVHQLVSACLD